MLNRKDISRIIGDLFRTELSSHQVDALAIFEDNTEELWNKLPMEIKQISEQKAATIFGFMPRTFSSLERMIDYSYASYLKNQQIAFLSCENNQVTAHVHTTNMMWEESREIAASLSGITRIISLVPSISAYGFMFTVILPHILQVPAMSLPAIPTQSWDALLRPGDLLVGFPLFWNHWLRCNDHFPEGIQVVSSTALCKEETIQGLFRSGVEQFIEIYGSNETGSIGFRRQATEPFKIFSFWEVDSEKPEPLIKRKSGMSWMKLPDHVIVPGARLIYPVSHFDGRVKVAGTNVYPAQVERILASHPAVKDCRVRLMRPEEGERLKAFIVLNEGYGPEHLGIVRTFLSQRLNVYEMPRTFTFGEVLPVTAAGRETDW